MLSRSAIQSVRSLSTSSVARAGHGRTTYPEPGHNLPFDITGNRYKLLFGAICFFGSAAAFPFWVIKRNWDKKH